MRITRNRFAACWVLFFSLTGYAGDKPIPCVLQAGDTQVLAVPVCIELEGITYAGDEHSPVLYRVDGDRKIAVPCQVENGHTARLWFILDRTLAPHEKVHYEIDFQEATEPVKNISTSMDARAITIRNQDRSILQYVHAVQDVPEGVDPLYRRSGFIHPLWSPAGKVLTRIQPPDHYHHFGLWNPWTRTRFQGHEVDFRNLGEGQGTVRFAGVLSTVSGPVFGAFKVRQEHVAFIEGADLVAMNEVWDVRAFVSRLEDKPVYVVDFTSILHCAIDAPIELTAYRYGGGIGFRATEQWHKDNCSVLTSEGKARQDADGTRARWCDVNGATGPDAFSGIVFCSHTSNREHPEPIRVWPLDANGEGGHVL